MELTRSHRHRDGRFRDITRQPLLVQAGRLRNSTVNESQYPHVKHDLCIHERSSFCGLRAAHVSSVAGGRTSAYAAEDVPRWSTEEGEQRGVNMMTSLGLRDATKLRTLRAEVLRHDLVWLRFSYIATCPAKYIHMQTRENTTLS